MPNKASEYVDGAYAHVDSILELHPAKHHQDDQVLINSQINDKITKLENEMQSSFSGLQCQVSQLIERVDATDKELVHLKMQFETRSDEILFANGKRDIDELSEKLMISQVKVDELKLNFFDLQTQLYHSIEEMKKESKERPANNALPSGNLPQPALNETMDILRSKVEHLVDNLIPKQPKHRSIIQSHRNETRQSYRPRPQSLLLESNLLKTMDCFEHERSYSATSSGHSSLSRPSQEYLPEMGITSQESPPEICITEQQDISLIPNTSASFLSAIGTNEPQMRHLVSTPAQLISQQSTKISVHHDIVELLWAMGDFVDQLKKLAGNFVGNTSDT